MNLSNKISMILPSSAAQQHQHQHHHHQHQRKQQEQQQQQHNLPDTDDVTWVIDVVANRNRLLSRRISLPGQSLRPLKKRRIVVDFTDYDHTDDNLDDATITKTKTKTKAKAKTKTKAKRKPPVVKRKKIGAITPPSSLPPSSSPTVTKKTVTWNDREGNVIHSQQDPSLYFPYYDEKERWYTRENYDDFLVDRIQTIEYHRGDNDNDNANSNSNSNSNGNSSFCIRGLEPLQDNTTSANYHSKKKLYHTTVIMEQVRQGMLGIKEPERFRFLVAPQTDLALHRAQELAAQDEREVYPFRTMTYSHGHSSGGVNSSGISGCGAAIAIAADQRHRQQQQEQEQYRRSSMSALSERQRPSSGTNSIYSSSSGTPTSNIYYKTNLSSFDSNDSTSSTSSTASSFDTTTRTNSAKSNNNNKNNAPSLFTDSIRKLQEQNARRLMGIYQQQNNGGTGGGMNTNGNDCSNNNNMQMMNNEGHKLFRFSARRNSVWGCSNTNMAASGTSALGSCGSISKMSRSSNASSSSFTVPTAITSNLPMAMMMQQQQQVSMGNLGGGKSDCNHHLQQQQQQHQQLNQQQLQMQMALMATRTTRFPIRRDTLSHLLTTTSSSHQHQHQHQHQQHHRWKINQ